MDENNKILKGIPSPAVVTEFPSEHQVNSLVRFTNPDSKFKCELKPLLDKSIWKSWKFSRLKRTEPYALGFK